MTALNNSKRRRQQKILAKVKVIDEELQHQIAVVEKAIETATGKDREHYRALLRRLQQVLDIKPDL